MNKIVTEQPKPLSDRLSHPAFKASAAAAALIYPPFCFFAAEYIHYADQEEFSKFLSARAPVVVFCVAALYLIYAAISLICRRFWPAAVLLGFFVVGGGIADYFKYRLTGEYLYPWDVAQQVGKLPRLLDFVKIPLPPLYLIMGILAVLMALLIGLTRLSVPLKWYIRLPAAALIVFFLVFSVSTPERVEKTLNRSSLYLEDMALQNSNYEQNGLCGAFVINLLSGGISRPDGYYPGLGGEILARYPEKPAEDDFARPDIILVLSESYWDARQLRGVEFFKTGADDADFGYSKDPMEHFDRIASDDGVISGSFYTSGFSGGTARPEFELLTGLTTDGLPSGSVPYQYIKSDFPCHVRDLKDEGYRCVGLHPYLPSFYRRKSVWPLLGFDECLFAGELEDISGIEPLYRGRQISDFTFVEYIKHVLENREEEQPLFVFAVSMENHQPYENKFADEEFTIRAEFEEGRYGESVQNAVLNFTQGLCDADESLARLYEYTKTASRPTMLIWFGDHAPTLGANLSGYVAGGLVDDPSFVSAAERQITQSTPFLVAANFPLADNRVLHMGKGNKVTSYNLLNGALKAAGAPSTPLGGFLADYAACRPDYNIRMGITPEGELKKFVNEHIVITYERLKKIE